MLPVFWSNIEKARDIKELWGRIYMAVERPENEVPNEELIGDIFKYESWCMSESQDEEVQDAVLNFYMEIPLSARWRRELPKYMGVEDFLGAQEIFAGQLTSEEFNEFRDEFLMAAAMLKKSVILNERAHPDQD